MKMMPKILAAFSIMLTIASIANANTDLVEKVFDGDTLSLNVQGEMLKIRLYGIDAPNGGQHGNVAATRFLRRLVLEHPVKIKIMDTELLKWPLAIVIREKKESSLNAAMVGNGYAWVNSKICTAEECAYWKRLESKARALKLGIWSDPDAVPPWEFETQQRR